MLCDTHISAWKTAQRWIGQKSTCVPRNLVRGCSGFIRLVSILCDVEHRHQYCRFFLSTVTSLLPLACHVPNAHYVREFFFRTQSNFPVVEFNSTSLDICSFFSLIESAQMSLSPSRYPDLSLSKQLRLQDFFLLLHAQQILLLCLTPLLGCLLRCQSEFDSSFLHLPVFQRQFPRFLPVHSLRFLRIILQVPTGELEFPA